MWKKKEKWERGCSCLGQGFYCCDKNTMTKTSWKERVYSPQTFVLLFITREGPERISFRAETWRQELIQKPWGVWGILLTGLLPMAVQHSFLSFLENPGPLALGASPTMACVGLLFLRSHWPPAQKGERSRSPKQRMDGSEYEGKNSQESTSERQLIFFCSGGKVYKGS